MGGGGANTRNGIRRLLAAGVAVGLCQLAACTTIRSPGGQDATYIGLVRVRSDAVEPNTLQQRSQVLGLWRDDLGVAGRHLGAGWRASTQLVVGQACRVIFNVATDQQLAEAERFIASSSGRENLCVSSPGSP